MDAEKPTMTPERIAIERANQDKQWGGHAHDDTHRPGEWCSYIDKQRRLARDADDPREYEGRLIKIAALAIAAFESSQRLNPERALAAPPVDEDADVILRSIEASIGTLDHSAAIDGDDWRSQIAAKVSASVNRLAAPRKLTREQVRALRALSLVCFLPEDGFCKRITEETGIEVEAEGE